MSGVDCSLSLKRASTDDISTVNTQRIQQAYTVAEYSVFTLLHNYNTFPPGEASVEISKQNIITLNLEGPLCAFQ